MSRVTGLARGIAWDPVEGADDYMLHVDLTDSAEFILEVDNGVNEPLATVTEPEFLFESVPGIDFDGADFAVVAHANQNGVDVYSDPHSPVEWQDIPLAFTPLAAPVNGRLVAA
jgi:hypothetical protein